VLLKVFTGVPDITPVLVLNESVPFAVSAGLIE
jgi:hypothetical protein